MSDTHRSSIEGGDEVNVLDLLIVLAKHKLLILIAPIVAGVIAAILSFQMPNLYTATTSILPPQQSQSSGGSVLAQIGGLTGLSGAASLAFRNPSEVYVSVLKSRTIADRLIDRFNLNALFQQQLQSSTRGVLASKTRISVGKEGIVTIDVDDEDPERAAKYANAYVEELHKLTNLLAFTEASQRRLFFERQLALARDDLATAEGAARAALERSGLALVEAQGRAIVDTSATLRAQITAKEVEIAAMRAFAAHQNPDILRAQEGLTAMKAQLAKIEGSVTPSNRNFGSKQGKGLDSAVLMRNLKYHETIYDLLAKQYEMAKIDEAKDSALIQVLDKAITPDRKSKPSRVRIVLLSAVISFVLSIVVALVWEAFSKLNAIPEQRRRLLTVWIYLSTWRRATRGA